MKNQPLKQHCFHAYLGSTGTTSTATRICFNPSCSLWPTLGSCPQILFPVFFMHPTLKKLKGHIALGVCVCVCVSIQKNEVTVLKFQ